MKHLKENNETYISHFKFACSLGVGFLYRSAFFLVHGFFPMVEVPKQLNIDATHEWLNKAKQYADKRKS